MCKYVFIWAVCPTTIEMDLTFVLVVKFITLKLNRIYYLVHAKGPYIALWIQKA